MSKNTAHQEISFHLLMGQVSKIVSDIDTTISELLSADGAPHSILTHDQLFRAMRYCTLAPCKRLRPILAIISTQLFGGIDYNVALKVACAIEFIHTYSIVHDDLPMMDNDDIRRGQPSCHKEFTEATAILVGDALLTKAFEILSDLSPHIDASIVCKLINLCAQEIGHHGMLKGQMSDILVTHGLDDTSLSPNQILEIHKCKTSNLFVLACTVGSIISNSESKYHDALTLFGTNFGIIFQLADDLEDSDDDFSNNRLSYVNHTSIDQCIEHIAILRDEALQALSIFSSSKSKKFMTELLLYIAQQDKQSRRSA